MSLVAGQVRHTFISANLYDKLTKVKHWHAEQMCVLDLGKVDNHMKISVASGTYHANQQIKFEGQVNFRSARFTMFKRFQWNIINCINIVLLACI